MGDPSANEMLDEEAAEKGDITLPSGPLANDEAAFEAVVGDEARATAP